MSENYNLQPDTNSQTVRNADSYNLDTREQLEADISKWWEGEWLRDLYNNEDMVRVVGRWLDRQAAIDRKEFQSILEEIQTCMRNGSR